MVAAAAEDVGQAARHRQTDRRTANKLLLLQLEERRHFRSQGRGSSLTRTDSSGNNRTKELNDPVAGILDALFSFYISNESLARAAAAGACCLNPTC
jgi:hypothetical protein